MTVKVIGKKSGSFVNEKTGEVVEYARLYCTAPFEEMNYPDAPKTEGIQCMEIKIPAEMLGNVKVGGNAKVYYNAKGRVEEIIPEA